jgi:hypothetical protein
LQDAADYILKLPKAVQKLEEWQTATEALIMAAEGRGPLMHARISQPSLCGRNNARENDSGLGKRPSVSASFDHCSGPRSA